MCRKEKFSECPGNPRRHFLELIRIFGERINVRGPTACPRDRGRPRGAGAPPTPVDRWWAPWPSSFARIFYFFRKGVPWSFRSFRELLFLHINNTMESLLKTASVRASFIQIMQVRDQNKGKSVRKSRYNRDITITHASPR